LGELDPIRKQKLKIYAKEKWSGAYPTVDSVIPAHRLLHLIAYLAVLLLFMHHRQNN
jgi:hypothetical protein